MGDFGEVRSLLHDAEPSREAFERLLGLFRQVEDRGEAERVWVPYALDRLRHWPLGTRHVDVKAFDARELRWMTLATSSRCVCDEVSGDALESLLWSPAIANLEELDLARAAPDVLDWLATSPHSGKLKRLSVNVSVRDSSRLAAFTDDAPFRLEAFELRGKALGGVRFTRLLESPAFEELRELFLSGFGLSDEGFVRLLTRPWFAGLTHLEVFCRGVDVHPSVIESCPHRAPFEVLRLSHNDRLSDEAIAAMVRAGWMDEHSELDLSYTCVGVETVDALVERSNLMAFVKLSLTGDGIGACEALARARLPRLEHLELRGGHLTATHALHILRSPGLESLSCLSTSGSVMSEEDAEGEVPEDRSVCRGPFELRIGNIGVGPLAVSAIVQTERLRRMTSLSLACNPLGVQEARALGGAVFEELEHLDVECCELGDEGVAALLEDAGRRFPSLKRLELDTNELTDASRDVLPGSGLRGLEDLRFWNNAVGPGFVASLVESPVVDALTFLDLSGCAQPDEVMKVLGASPRLGALKRLHMGGGDEIWEGPLALIGSAMMSGLEEFQAPYPYRDSGAFSALVGSPSVRSLELFAIGGRWSVEMWKACATSPYLSYDVMEHSSEPEMQQALAELVRDGVTLNAWATTRAEEYVDRQGVEG